ncbi:MAG: heavy-metal-associated domain-containing protein [Alphaproteobacteria bacterium]|jgi:copper chaperone|nr:heavy-metal-associated domain-containing protein [Alphaproteobacteria bacterium]MBT4085740.1 heavy-metal-associated domain-containing protein [Alphaproteobacteria bacterium]MBT4543319.1 heavy-metal-associated domain-containing protein [Alphaproteobacteria bacterium]MBT7747192.1 heavy-metal-associated domain-containing protein [Alphaproteobacteria bacterium]
MTTYLVEGMTCQGCVNAVTNAIKTRLADVDVSVELEGGKVTVSGDDSAAVIAAIDDAGFDYMGEG